MKKFILFALALLTAAPVYASVTLTKDQFDNIDVIDQKMKEKFPQFKGFNGSKDKLEVIGLDDVTVQQEISKMDVQKEKNALDEQNPFKIKQKNLVKKLKALGLDDNDLSVLLKNAN